MKKNFLHFYILAVALFAASAFTACSNNDEQANGTPVNTYTITVNATKGDDVSSAPSNRALSFVGPTLTATWTKDDVVAVYKSETHLGDLTALSDGASTTLTGTLTGSVAIGDELTLKFLSPDYTPQTGTLDYIAAHCDYATATVTVSSISGNNITTTAANFTNQQAIVKFSLKNKANDNDLSVSTLVVKVGSTSYTVTPASATNVLYVAVPGFASNDVTLTATVGSNTYTYVKTGATFENGKYYTVSVKMFPVPTSNDIGKVIGLDAKIYETKDAATSAGTTPIAMVAYIGSPNLAIALTDDESAYFSKAPEKAAAHTPKVALGTWKLPSKDDWQNMFLACRIDGDAASAAADMKVAGFKEKVSNAGGDGFADGTTYWCSTPSDYRVYFTETSYANISSSTNETRKVRAVLEF